MKTVVYLIRHSKKLKKGIEQNNEFVLDSKNMCLSVEGEILARNLCHIEELNQVEKIYSSDYARAVSTAKYLAEKLNLPIYLDNRLGEIKSGTIEMDQKEFKLKRETDLHYKMPDGESFLETKERMVKVFWEIIEKNKGQTIAIFSHHLALFALLMNFCNQNYKGNHLYLTFKNELEITTKWDAPDIYKLVLQNTEIITIEHIKVEN